MRPPRLAALLFPVVLLGWSVPALAQPAPEATFDVSTPRRAARTFILASRAGDYERAARVLDLGALPAVDRPDRGPRLARMLKMVLDQELWVDFDLIPDEPAAAPVTLGTIRAGETAVPIGLTRSGDAWRFSRATVAAVPALFDAHGPAWVESVLPDVLSRVRVWELELWQWIGLALALLLAYFGAILFTGVLTRVGGRVVARTETPWDDRLLELVRQPTRLLATVLLTWLFVEWLHLATPAQEVVDKLLLITLIGALAWYGVRAVRLGADRVEALGLERVEREEIDEASLRGVRTQVAVLRRVLSIVVGLLAVSMMLVQFDIVRTVGMSLLASAGIAGVVLGLAAQRSIATLLAGLQLSITQPIRIGDTVIVEGEWGMIEEINLTYVVVKVWDQRRLVVPMSRFLEQSFQNWTKTSPELLGTVFFHADYRLPIDAVRAELERILEAHPKWDRRAQSVLVTDTTERTIQVRALVSAANASDAWELRCHVREALIAFLREHEGGRYLPRVRIESDAPSERGLGA